MDATCAHSWQASAASGMSIGYKGTQVASKAMTLAAIELFTNEGLHEEARAARTINTRYSSATAIRRSIIGGSELLVSPKANIQYPRYNVEIVASLQTVNTFFPSHVVPSLGSLHLAEL